MNYYPKVKSNKSYNKNLDSNTYSLETIVRLKHKDGFYYLVKYTNNYNRTEIDLRNILSNPVESISEKIWNQLWQNLIIAVEDLKNNYQYNSTDKAINPIDPYQGKINIYDSKLKFEYYGPDLSYEELISLNNYMKTI